MWNNTLVTIFFGAILLTLKFFLSAAEASPRKPVPVSSYIIVLDPGHGGEDVGSIGRAGKKPNGKSVDIYEKDIVLNLAKRVERYLRDPKFTKSLGRPVRVVMTRNRDLALSLDSRAMIVRKTKANLFLSLHMNSETSGTARGFETYFLNNTTKETDAHVEKLNRRQRRDVAAATPDLSLLLRSVASDSMVGESRKAAEMIQKAISQQTKRDRLGLEDRGVRQSLLQVLLDARVPAVLVEGAFLSNPEDLRLARSNLAQDSLARGIALGAVRYLARSRL